MKANHPKEWPLIFTEHSVLMMLAGTKTQTRRLPGPRMWSVDGGPWPRGWQFDLANAWVDAGPSPAGNDGPYLKARRLATPDRTADVVTVHRLYPRVKVGDRIWGREAWRTDDDDVEAARAKYEDAFGPGAGLYHRAGMAGPDVFTWRSPLFMPRWACRLVREVVDVRVERLQTLTALDARAEGIRVVAFRPDEGFPLCDGHTFGPDDGKSALYPTAREAFMAGWDLINGHRPGALAAANPLVLALTVRSAE